MAKLSKKQKRALNNRAKDGKITSKDVQKLTSLGISQGRIQQKADNANASIENKGGGGSASKKADKAVAKTTADGKIKAGEARKLYDLGVSKEAVLTQAPGTTIGPVSSKTLQGHSDPKGEVAARREFEEARASRVAKRAEAEKAANWLSDKDRNLLLQDINRQTNTESDWRMHPNGQDTTEPWDLETAIRKGSNADLWKKVAKKGAGVNFNSSSDIAMMIDWVQKYGKGASGSGSGGNGSGSSGAPRDTGEYNDIMDALKEDEIAGQEMAEQIKGVQAKLGGISPETQAVLDGLKLDNSNLLDRLKTANQTGEQQVAGLQTQIGGLEDLLLETSTKYETALIDQATSNQDAIDRMQALMLQQQQSAANTQALLQSQLTSTQTALSNQQRMATNLSNAYVPPAEQSALTVSYGDTRKLGRRARDNSLSDLSIVSGVNNSNSLSGLQIAG